jgi:hypothetical protein
MEKELIEVYADPELKRRVEIAAAKHNVPVAEYLLEAIEEKLADEAVVEENNPYITRMGVKNDPTLIADLRELRERILAERGGKPIEIDVLEQLRAEQDDELTGMR